MEDWLIKCNYPAKIIQEGIHNAKLQGPAPKQQDRGQSHVKNPRTVLRLQIKNFREKSVFANFLTL